MNQLRSSRESGATSGGASGGEKMNDTSLHINTSTRADAPAPSASETAADADAGSAPTRTATETSNESNATTAPTSVTIKSDETPVPDDTKDQTNKTGDVAAAAATKAGATASVPDQDDSKGSAKKPKYAIGQAVEKFFAGHGKFRGKITALCTPENPHYRVTYVDGDSEDIHKSAIHRYVTADAADNANNKDAAIAKPQDGAGTDNSNNTAAASEASKEKEVASVVKTAPSKSAAAPSDDANNTAAASEAPKEKEVGSVAKTAPPEAAAVPSPTPTLPIDIVAETKIIPMVSLSQPGALGCRIEKAAPTATLDNEHVRITAVVAGSQAAKAGLQRGDIITYPGTNGAVPIPYDFFFSMAQGTTRPVVFDIRREPGALTAPSSKKKKKKQATKKAEEKVGAASGGKKRSIPGALAVHNDIDNTTGAASTPSASNKKPKNTALAKAQAEMEAKLQAAKNKSASAPTNGITSTSSKSSTKSSKAKGGSKKKRKKKKEDYEESVYEEVPNDGFVCKDSLFYSSLDNETPSSIADKLGCSWKDLVNHRSNTSRYGKLNAGARFRAGTVLAIPKAHSRWKVKQLQNKQRMGDSKLTKCNKCRGIEKPEDETTNPMLMCDGCDETCHMKCTGLTSVPEGDWFCDECLEILRARKAKQERDANAEGTGFTALVPSKATSSKKMKSKSPSPSDKLSSTSSLRAKLPELPDLNLDKEVASRHSELQSQLRLELKRRRKKVSADIAETHRAVKDAMRNRIPELERDLANKRRELSASQAREQREKAAACRRFSIIDFGGHNNTQHSRNTWIEARNGQGWTTRYEERREVKYSYSNLSTKVSDNWRILAERRSRVISDPSYREAIAATKRDKEAYEQCKEDLSETRSELFDSDVTESEDVARHNAEYNALLGVVTKVDADSNQPKMPVSKDFVPKLMGTIRIEDETDVNSMNMLTEPTELVIFLPCDDLVGSEESSNSDSSTKVVSTAVTSSSSGSDSGVINLLSDDSEEEEAVMSLNKLTVKGTYAVFARQALFDTDRDDSLPIDTNGLRSSQRALMRLLLASASNAKAVVSRAKTPPSVRVRGVEGEPAASSALYELSELVRDCNSDLDISMEPTPPQMSRCGLELRAYQKASLRWLLDKERVGQSGMGFASEVWDRLRFFGNAQATDYYYCELTGTFSLDIFDFRSETGQKDAALNFGGSLPTSGILGEEMGLGKTIISLSLIISNPPPMEDRVLKREHTWALEKHQVNHDEYVEPHSVNGAVKNNGNTLLSNGTLVIVPMTLISQWQAEIERFAPWLKVLTLHTDASVKQQEMASADVVIMSSVLLQRPGAPNGSSRAKTKGSKAQVTPRRTLNAVRRIHWHRIIVDEAHYANVGIKFSLELASLSASHRLCVTGTPLGNTLEDLQAELRFLRVPQFSRTKFFENAISGPFCERNAEALRILRSLLSRIIVRHSKEQEIDVCLPPRTVDTEHISFSTQEETDLYNAIESKSRESFERLRTESIATLKTKTSEMKYLLLCARQACSHPFMIDPVRMDRMNQRTDPKYREMRKSAGEDEASGAQTRSDVLSRAAAMARPSAEARVRSIVMRFQEGDEYLMECPVCLDVCSELNVAITPCGHITCTDCLLNVLGAASCRREASGNCPTCRDTVKRSEITFLGQATDAGERNIIDISAGDEGDGDATSLDTNFNGFQYKTTQHNIDVKGGGTLRAGYTESDLVRSRDALRDDAARLPTLPAQFLSDYDKASGRIGPKIANLLQEIKAMEKNDPTAKAVVFSQFVPLLDIASQELTARGIRFSRIYGSDKQHERADALLDFSSEPNIKTMLLSMKAGAVGLNLTAASHIFILDCTENSALEEQAIDRVHRIGQTRPVVVKRFIMAKTVEERIVAVRRTLSNDKPTAGTAVCDSSLMTDADPKKKPAKRARTNGGTDGDGKDEAQYDGNAQLKRLATIFNTTLVPSVHKA